MSSAADTLKKYLLLIGSMKFALIIIAAFIIFLVAGTLLEVQYGHIFSAYFIYDSFAFAFVIFLMLLSLLISMFTRPFNKKFYGFFLIHTGLIILAIGALQSKFSATEGHLSLFPLDSSNVLEKNEFEIQVHQDGNDTAVFKVPYRVLPTDLNQKIGNVEVVKYLPFAKESADVVSSEGHYLYEIEINNDQISENAKLTNNLSSYFYQVNTRFGPLNVFSFKGSLKGCLNASDYILVDSLKGTCQSLSSAKVVKEKSEKIFKVKVSKATMKFAPEFSHFPLDPNGREILDSQYQLFSTHLLREKPSVLIGTENVYFYDESLVSSRQSKVELPWMGLVLDVNRQLDKTLGRSFVESKELGMFRPAAQVKFENQTYWINLDNSAVLKNASSKYLVQMKKQVSFLPFSLTLNDFIREKDFGTGRDASYESKISIQTPKGLTDHSITLNNPVKQSIFTIYQDSYKELEAQGKYLSVLKVNIDPGRNFKYIGWFIALFGMILHFAVRRLRL